MSASGFPEQSSFSFAPAEILDSKKNLTFSTISMLVSHSRWVNVIQEWCWLAQINFFHKYVPHLVNVLFLPSQCCISSTHTDKICPFFSLCTKKHSRFGAVSHSSSNGTSSNCLFTQQRCQWMSVHISFKENHWIFFLWHTMNWKSRLVRQSARWVGTTRWHVPQWHHAEKKEVQRALVSDERLKRNLAGHTIDPGTYSKVQRGVGVGCKGWKQISLATWSTRCIQEGVLCFDHHAARQNHPRQAPSRVPFNSVWIFNVWPRFGPFVSWRTYPFFWTLCLWNSEQPGSVLQFYLSVCWYDVSCLSITVLLSCNDIHDFCCCHLKRRWTLFRKDCIGSRVVFYTMSPRSTTRPLYFWNLGSNSAIFEMTDVHPCSKVDFLLSLCASRITSFLALDVLLLPGWNRLKLLPSLVHCCFRIRKFHRLRHRDKLANKVVMCHRIKSFACDVILMIFR